MLVMGRSAMMFAILKNRKGTVLIGISIAIAVVSILFFGMLTNILMQQKNLQAARIAKNRDHLQTLIQKFIADPTLIYRSINLVGNEKFKACYQGGTHTTCASEPCCNKGFGGAGNDFALLDPTVPNVIFSPTEGERFSGPPVSPQRYDINGVKCVTPSDECSFVMTTSFEAICPGGTDPCDKAQSIIMSYSFGMDRSPSSGPILAIRTESAPPPINLKWDIAWTPVEPALSSLCWTSGTECPTEVYNSSVWVTKIVPPSIPLSARKLLVYYHCYNAKLNFKMLSALQSHPLCFNSSGHDIGQAWIPLVLDADGSLKYEIKYESLTIPGPPPSGMAMINIIGWSE